MKDASSPDSPATDSMRPVILQQLSDIEKKHNVTILFACNSGSRAYGFASPHSDYDVRFVYVHKLPWYLSVHPGRDVIERPIDNTLDLHGWELRKALGLLHNSNPMLLEWLRSPVEHPSRYGLKQRMLELATYHFSPERGYYHYISMARNNRAYLAGGHVPYKKYFAVLRPLLAAQWIRDVGSIPPVRFDELVKSLVTDQTVLQAIGALLRVKTGVGKSLGEPEVDLTLIRDFIEAKFSQVADWKPEPDHKLDSGLLDDYLYEAVTECSR